MEEIFREEVSLLCWLSTWRTFISIRWFPHLQSEVENCPGFHCLAYFACELCTRLPPFLFLLGSWVGSLLHFAWHVIPCVLWLPNGEGHGMSLKPECSQRKYAHILHPFLNINTQILYSRETGVKVPTLKIWSRKCDSMFSSALWKVVDSDHSLVHLH